MTAFTSGDSVFIEADGTVVPIFNSPLITQSSDGGVSANTDGTGFGLELTIIGDADSTVITDQNSAPDTINSGGGNDLINVGGEDDFVDGSDGADFIFGGGGDDTLRGGKGADFLRGGEGNDQYMITGDAEDGAFGANSDLVLDEQGIPIADFMFNFDDNGDQLVLQDLGLGTSVTYDDQTGAVIMTDETGESYPIAYMQPGLDITTTDDGNGNFTLE